MQHFVYIWYDVLRRMFYIGMHSGRLDDNYVSSSRWFSGEVRYRPNDFRRKIIRICESRSDARQLEQALLAKIKDQEFGKRYYNLKNGKPKGTSPWNKGKKDIYSFESLEKMSNQKTGKPSSTKGKKNPLAADNGKRGAAKSSKTTTGRRRYYLTDSEWVWMYTRSDGTQYYKKQINAKKWKEVDITPPLS